MECRESSHVLERPSWYCVAQARIELEEQTVARAFRGEDHAVASRPVHGEADDSLRGLFCPRSALAHSDVRQAQVFVRYNPLREPRTDQADPEQVQLHRAGSRRSAGVDSMPVRYQFQQAHPERNTLPGHHRSSVDRPHDRCCRGDLPPVALCPRWEWNLAGGIECEPDAQARGPLPSPVCWSEPRPLRSQERRFWHRHPILRGPLTPPSSETTNSDQIQAPFPSLPPINEPPRR
jgi:hypothetical protein